MAGQALVAASRTVEDHALHSLHAYFRRGGDPYAPILYEVDRIRDGPSFDPPGRGHPTRGVISHMSVSYQLPEHGFERQFDSPLADTPPPDELPDFMTG